MNATELVVVMVALVAWAVPLALLIVGLVFVVRLSSRVRSLEESMASLRPQPGSNADSSVGEAPPTN
jgi:cytochrome c-type biogenesis protein CcmH/NrfF